MEFLPPKMASSEERKMTIKARPTIQDLMKAAMAGTINRVNIAREAAIQAGDDGQDKQAEATTSVPTDQLHKLADALDFIGSKLAAEAANQPGHGPGALEVMQASASGSNVDAGQLGQAKHQIPNDPPMKSGDETRLDDNKGMMHGEQPAKLGHAQLVAANLQRLGVKVAENMDESHIRQTGDTPPAALEAGQAGPSMPSQSSLVGSNQSAIDYTKREALTSVREGMKPYLTEPAMSKATDKTLNQVLTHTDQAGAKLSSVRNGLLKTAATRALMLKLASQIPAKRKAAGFGGSPGEASDFAATSAGSSSMPAQGGITPPTSTR
jgi:hypothetical protein